MVYQKSLDLLFHVCLMVYSWEHTDNPEATGGQEWNTSRCTSFSSTIFSHWKRGVLEEGEDWNALNISHFLHASHLCPSIDNPSWKQQIIVKNVFWPTGKSRSPTSVTTMISLNYKSLEFIVTFTFSLLYSMCKSWSLRWILLCRDRMIKELSVLVFFLLL